VVKKNKAALYALQRPHREEEELVVKVRKLTRATGRNEIDCEIALKVSGGDIASARNWLSKRRM
jgi:translation elongation factor EF-Ts